MARKVDVDDLIDSTEVANILRLSTRRTVSTLRARHADFPAPVKVSDGGRCQLWLRGEVLAWGQATGRL